MLYAIVGILVIILDQGVKYWVTTNLMVGTVTEPLIPGVLSLVRLHNDGAAFSFLAGGGARIYFIILTAVFTIAVIIALATNFINGRFGRWCLVLVTAGGLSNCLDRVLYGYVVDMFKIDLFDFAVFNVADIFITVFALLFIVYIIFGGEGKDDKEDEFDEDDDEDADREPLNVSFKKKRAAERDAAPAKPARERAADAKAKKYRTDDNEDDDVASPRFGFGKHKKADDEDTKPAAKQPAKARAAADNSPAARREKSLEGFGRSAAPAQPARPAAKQGAKKTRYEEDYEAYTAAHPETKTVQRKTAPAAKSAPAFDPADPFAEWERANARVESRQNTGSTAKAMGVNTQSAARPAAPAAPAVPVQRPAAPQTPARPAAPAAAPKPAPKSSSADEFDLDDILNEFK